MRIALKYRGTVLRMAAALVLLPAAASVVVAQEPAGAKPETPAETKPAPQPTVSVDARDSDVRQVVEDMFRQARITNYSISNDVSGTITLSLKDKPFEEALSLVARVASPPLSWSKTDGIYFVRSRPVRRTSEIDALIGPDRTETVVLENGARYEVVKLMYTDPRLIVEALDLLRPDNLTAAVAIEASNDVLTRWGPEGSTDFVKGSIPVEWQRFGSRGGQRGSGAGQDSMGAAGMGSLRPPGVDRVLGIDADNSMMVRGRPEGIATVDSLAR